MADTDRPAKARGSGRRGPQGARVGRPVRRPLLGAHNLPDAHIGRVAGVLRYRVLEVVVQALSENKLKIVWRVTGYVLQAAFATRRFSGMKPFEIFRAGRHAPSSGAAISFSDADLQAAVAGYDPAKHEAPIVVGHPRDNLPAYGWVRGLSFSDGAIVADPQQIDPAFAEMVAAGRFKKRSASFYKPDAPNNPTPGSYYLRHVGFLGAQPPAVKGLRDVNFTDAEEGTIEFADSMYVAGVIASITRRMRDFFLTEYGAEKADQVLPDYLVADLEAEGRKAGPDAMIAPLFNEQKGIEMNITQEQLDAASAAAAAAVAQRDAAIAQVAALEARVASFSEREAALARQSVEATVAALVNAGQMLPAQAKAAVEFAMSLADADATFEFGENPAEKFTQRGAYLKQIAAAPKFVDYGERAPAGGLSQAADRTVQQLAKSARALVAKRKSEGSFMSYSEAVAEVAADLS